MIAHQRSALLQDANLKPIPTRPVKSRYSSMYSNKCEIWFILVSCPNSLLFPWVARDANMRHIRARQKVICVDQQLSYK